MEFKDTRIATMALSFLPNVVTGGIPLTYSLGMYDSELQPQALATAALELRLQKLACGLEKEILGFGDPQNIIYEMSTINKLHVGEDIDEMIDDHPDRPYLNLLLSGMAFNSNLWTYENIDMVELPEVLYGTQDGSKTIDIGFDVPEQIINNISFTWGEKVSEIFNVSGFVTDYFDIVVDCWANLLQSASWVDNDRRAMEEMDVAPADVWVEVMASFSSFCKTIDALPELSTPALGVAA